MLVIHSLIAAQLLFAVLDMGAAWVVCASLSVIAMFVQVLVWIEHWREATPASASSTSRGTYWLHEDKTIALDPSVPLQISWGYSVDRLEQTPVGLAQRGIQYNHATLLDDCDSDVHIGAIVANALPKTSANITRQDGLVTVRLLEGWRGLLTVPGWLTRRRLRKALGAAGIKARVL